MARQMIDRVKELMTQPERIRNIAIAAHIDHGKCVSGETRIMLADGRFETAEALFKAFAKENDIVYKDKEKTVHRSNGIAVYSLDKKTGLIETTPVNYAWKLQGGSMLRVRLRNGLSISTTPEHKYIIFNGTDFEDKPANVLELGDRVVCARHLQQDVSIDLKSEIITRLSNHNGFYAYLKQDFTKTLYEIILFNGIVATANKISELAPHDFSDGARKGRYRLSDLYKLTSLAGVNSKNLYDAIEYIAYRSGKDPRWAKNSLKMKLPQSLEDFFYLTGMLFGDGYKDKLVAGKEELGFRFARICTELGLKPYWRRYSRCPEVVSGGGYTLLEVLSALFKYPERKKSHSIYVSDFLGIAPTNCIASFLRGYFDCDGTVEKSRRAVSLTSASQKMLSDVQLLLLRFGCLSIRQGNTIYISGRSALAFQSTIGFGLSEKQAKLGHLCSKARKSLVSDLLPIGQLLSELNKGNSLNSIDHHMYKYVKGNYIPDIETAERLMLVMQQKGYNVSQLKKLLSPHLAYIEVVEIAEEHEDEVYDFTVEPHKNFIAEGMVIHNTTLSDALLAGAGMISEELAGKQLALDFHADEQERGITIDSANVSMVHELEGGEFLINLIDTPGHVDFGGDVTRAMRAVDGCVVLVDAVEGMMPQTETVLRQALRERVKPILFINKVDRLVKELKLTPVQMQERFVRIIENINRFIRSVAPEDFKSAWQMNVQNGSVGFGSGFHKWAFSFPYMQKHKLTFKDVIDTYSVDNPDSKALAKKAPLYKVLLEMVIKHLPNPIQAQKYRVPKIWHGDIDSELGKSLISCDPNGPIAFVVTKIVMDKHAGEVAAGRLFSGTVRQGDEVYMNWAKKAVRVQQVNVYKGAQRIQVESATPGNIIGLVGLRGSFAGETVSSQPMEAFEAIKHLFEPVVTKSIEPKSAADLPKLIEVLRQVAKEDPTILIEINEETGENLISGMGELHLEVVENRIRTERGVNVITSPPIVVYRESVSRKSGEVEGKSPNKHNKFYFVIEPLDDGIYQAIKAGEFPEGRLKKKDDAVIDKLKSLGVDAKEAKSYREFYKGNALIESTRGIVHIGEVIELVMDGFEQVMDEGPLAREPGVKMKVTLVDTKLHEDSIHRGPAQVLPAVREAIKLGMIDAKAMIYEPLQVIQIESPSEHMGEISKLVQNKRGQLIDMQQEGEHITIKAKLPVGEMFGLTSDLRSATNGRGNHFVVDQMFEKLPESLKEKVMLQIRERKGLKKDLNEIV